jgi:LmbE family N-acetylglucosaminyl deacetylase
LGILAIGGHPDDIEFGCFGTLAGMCRKEKISMLVFTRGEITAKAGVRTSEARKSAAILGAEIKLLSYPDGELRQTGETVQWLRDEIIRTKARTVFCPHIEDSHQDHVAAGRIGMSSWKFVDQVLFYETPSTINFQPNVYFDITRTFESKKKAIELFQSQKSKPALNTDQVKGLAQYRAWQCNRSNALFEAFVLGRAIRDSSNT